MTQVTSTKRWWGILWAAWLGVVPPAALGATGTAQGGSVGQSQEQQPAQAKVNRFGLSYFSFFDGPGLAGNAGITPNWLGRPFDDGLVLSNLISLKYRLNEKFALDLQTRTQVVFNNGTNAADFRQFRWQSPRIGVSGPLASGSEWSLSGAINTDFPYSFPAPFGGGLLATQRTVVFNPGMFAGLTYKPRRSRWSFFTLITPRYFFYGDNDAAEPQLAQSGLSAGLKPELVLQFSPSATYSVTEVFGLRIGTVLDYRKLVLSGWNPLSASLRTSDTQSQAWRLWATPLQLGFNLDLSKQLSVFTFVNAYPVAAQRVRRDGSSAGFGETTSVGMWISGTLL